MRSLYWAVAAAAGTLLGAVTAGAQTSENVVVLGERGPVDFPASTVVLDDEQLSAAGIDGLFQLSEVTPGLRVDRYGGSTQATLRGIGVQNVLGPGLNSPVGIYVDGFYQPGLDSSIFDFADLTGVEVLRVPQGTQFGQNAIGGAILLTTADPAFETAGRAAVSYGSFNDRRFQAYGTTALTSSLAANLSAYHRESDNYLHDITTGKPSAPLHDTVVRGKLLYQPQADMHWILAAQFSDADDPTSTALLVHRPVAAVYHDLFGVPQVHTDLPFHTSFNHRAAADPQAWSLSLTGEMALGFGTLTSRSQFRVEHGNVLSDLDGTTTPYWNADYRQRDQVISQEFNLAGNDAGPLQWQTGLYYSNDQGSLLYSVTQDIFSTGIPTSLFGSNLRVNTDSLGLFGSASWHMAPDWELDAGGRFTHERKSLHALALIPASNDQAWDDFSPKLALRHMLDDDNSLYASFTRGFMGGNYNYLGVGPRTAVRPQTATQYEVGFNHAGDRWSLDADLFDTGYHDLQAFTYFSACGCFQFSNVPRARSWGGEASLHVQLSTEFSLVAGAAYTHARYGDFTGEAPTGQPFVPPNYGYLTGPTNFTGGSMIRSPDWSGNVALSWTRPTAFGQLSATANLYLTSTVPFTPDRQVSQPGYGLLNLSLGWTAPDKDWKITATGENLTDKRYTTFSAEGLLGDSVAYGAPASWLVQLVRAL